jgi:uncharacterized membrane protein YccC
MRDGRAIAQTLSRRRPCARHTPAAMSAVADIAREAFRVEDDGVDWRSGLAGAAAAVGPLVVGIALGDPQGGFTAAIGGLNTALCVPRAGVRSRLWWGTLSASISCASLLLAFSAAGETGPLVLVTFGWVGLLAFARAAGPRGALLGFSSAAVFVILAGLPGSATPIGVQLGDFLLGAIPGLALMVLARRGPEVDGRLVHDSLAAVRDGLAGDRALMDHALRLAVAVSLATLLYAALGLEHGYWIALTTLAVLQPGEHATRVRGIQRLAGTLGGAALILLITLITDERAVLLVCAAIVAFGLYALDHRSYFWLVVLLTPTVLFMISAVDFQGDDIALQRVADSTLGIALGLAIGELVWEVDRLVKQVR